MTKQDIENAVKDYLKALDDWRRIEVWEKDPVKRERYAKRKWNKEQALRQAVGLPKLGEAKK